MEKEERAASTREGEASQYAARSGKGGKSTTPWQVLCLPPLSMTSRAKTNMVPLVNEKASKILGELRPIHYKSSAVCSSLHTTHFIFLSILYAFLLSSRLFRLSRHALAPWPSSAFCRHGSSWQGQGKGFVSSLLVVLGKYLALYMISPLYHSNVFVSFYSSI